MSEIDWNTELRKIEREYDGLPPEPSPTELRERRAAERRLEEEAAAEQRVAVVGASMRLVLVASLLTALWWWPYAAHCGPGLLGLLATQCMVVVGGVWVATYTFRYRLAVGHTAALLLVLTGLVLVGAQVLPHFGYVRIVGMPVAHWQCPAAGL